MNMPSISSRKFMRQLFLFVAAMMLTFGGDTYAESAGQGSNLLTQVQTIPLDGVEGRIDHFGLDAKGKRLFVSALGNDTVEVVDLAAGKVTQHIRNLRAPQGIGFAPESNRLAVANDQDGSCRLYDGTSLQQTAGASCQPCSSPRAQRKRGEPGEGSAPSYVSSYLVPRSNSRARRRASLLSSAVCVPSGIERLSASTSLATVENKTDCPN
jgi:hypothetical protein